MKKLLVIAALIGMVLSFQTSADAYDPTKPFPPGGNFVAE